MLTKKDLTLIQSMFYNSKKEIVSEVTEKVTERVTEQVTKKVTQSVMGQVEKLFQKNINDLVELITVGFHIQDTGFKKTDSILGDHENRIGNLERKTFKTN